MGMIKRAWRGEERLWKAYWILGWVYPIVFGIAVAILGKIVPLLGMLTLLTLPYTIVWMISAWRCAWNCAWKGWGYIVRALILFIVLAIPLGIVVGGVSKARELIKMAECKKEFQAKAQQQGLSWSDYRRQHAEEFDKCTGIVLRKSLEIDKSMAKLDDVMKEMKDKQPEMDKAFDKADAAFAKLDVALQKQAQEKKCVDYLHQQAAEKNLDPIDYEVHNQEWIKQCMAREKENAIANPVVQAPVASPVQAAVAPAVPAYTNPCEQKMADYAVANHADPKAYIAQNQSYLQQCMAQSAPAAH